MTSSLHLIKLLGSGCYGEVHLASFDTMKEPIAVKFFTRDEETATKEIGALYRLQKHVPPLRVPRPCFALIPPEHSDSVAVLMSYVPGKTFADVIWHTDNVALIFDLIEQLLSQMAMLHERGMNHGDLHAENVLVLPTQEVVLIDVSFSDHGDRPCPIGSLTFKSIPRQRRR